MSSNGAVPHGRLTARSGSRCNHSHPGREAVERPRVSPVRSLIYLRADPRRRSLRRLPTPVSAQHPKRPESRRSPVASIHLPKSARRRARNWCRGPAGAGNASSRAAAADDARWRLPCGVLPSAHSPRRYTDVGILNIGVGDYCGSFIHAYCFLAKCYVKIKNQVEDRILVSLIIQRCLFATCFTMTS